MYTKVNFGKELKERVALKQDIPEIGAWSYDVYLSETENDGEFIDILLILSYMEDGPEFELSYKRLNEIADDLIAGKKYKHGLLNIMKYQLVIQFPEEIFENVDAINEVTDIEDKLSELLVDDDVDGHDMVLM